MTRIIAGIARGRRLAVPANGTRPTSDRVRESLFSTLESELRADGTAWPGTSVLDLFAGSGALGLEALSRGAAGVVLVEKSRAAARTITANIQAVDCPGAQVLIRDARQLPAAPPPGDPSTMCLLDPPYDWPVADLRDLLAGLVRAGWLSGDAIVVVERPARDPGRPFPDTWPEARRRTYGDTALWYGRSVGAAGARPEEGSR